MRTVLHIDFNSYFATVEQQANPHLRGKPIGVTGGDRMKRTVVGAASVEAKTFGVRTGMQLWEALKLCPQLVLVQGDSDKYLSCTKKFLNILKDYTPLVEVFSIDECFLEVVACQGAKNRSANKTSSSTKSLASLETRQPPGNSKVDSSHFLIAPDFVTPYYMALEIKARIHKEIGEWIRCSIGISYNKLMAKLAGSLQKPDGLVIIPDQETAIRILDNQPLDEICGIGSRIKAHLNKMGVFNFRQLRQVPKSILLFEFKSYGEFLYSAARGLDNRLLTPFYEKEEVKSVGHRLTMGHDTKNPEEIKQVLLKLTELVARRMRAKRLVGRTVSCWFRYKNFEGGGMQTTILDTNDGLDLFNASWRIFNQMCPLASSGFTRAIRMIGISASNLKPQKPENLSFLEEIKRREVITSALDKINNKYGEFTLQRGILLQSAKIKRMPNPFLADRRFKL